VASNPWNQTRQAYFLIGCGCDLGQSQIFCRWETDLHHSQQLFGGQSKIETITDTPVAGLPSLFIPNAFLFHPQNGKRIMCSRRASNQKALRGQRETTDRQPVVSS
jgi:hypothetical protein